MTYRKMPDKASEEEIKELARQRLEGRVWSWIDVEPHMVRSVFLPVALGGLNGWTRDQLSRLTVFAVVGVHDRSEWGINGLPIFMSCAVWRAADFTKALVMAERMEQALESVG